MTNVVASPFSNAFLKSVNPNSSTSNGTLESVSIASSNSDIQNSNSPLVNSKNYINKDIVYTQPTITPSDYTLASSIEVSNINAKTLVATIGKETNADSTEAITFSDEWSNSAEKFDEKNIISSISISDLSTQDSNIIYDQVGNQLFFKDSQVGGVNNSGCSVSTSGIVPLIQLTSENAFIKSSDKIKNFGKVYDFQFKLVNFGEHPNANASICSSVATALGYVSFDKMLNDEIVRKNKIDLLHSQCPEQYPAYNGFLVSPDYINGGWINIDQLSTNDLGVVDETSSLSIRTRKIVDAKRILLKLILNYSSSIVELNSQNKLVDFGVRVKDTTTGQIFDYQNAINGNASCVGNQIDLTYTGNMQYGTSSESNAASATCSPCEKIIQDKCANTIVKVDNCVANESVQGIVHEIMPQIRLNPLIVNVTGSDFVNTIDPIQWTTGIQNIPDYKNIFSDLISEWGEEEYNIGHLNVPRAFHYAGGDSSQAYVCGGFFNSTLNGNSSTNIPNNFLNVKSWNLIGDSTVYYEIATPGGYNYNTTNAFTLYYEEEWNGNNWYVKNNTTIPTPKAMGLAGGGTINQEKIIGFGVYDAEFLNNGVVKTLYPTSQVWITSNGIWSHLNNANYSRVSPAGYLKTTTVTSSGSFNGTSDIAGTCNTPPILPSVLFTADSNPSLFPNTLLHIDAITQLKIKDAMNGITSNSSDKPITTVAISNIGMVFNGWIGAGGNSSTTGLGTPGSDINPFGLDRILDSELTNIFEYMQQTNVNFYGVSSTNPTNNGISLESSVNSNVGWFLDSTRNYPVKTMGTLYLGDENSGVATGGKTGVSLNPANSINATNNILYSYFDDSRYSEFNNSIVNLVYEYNGVAWIRRDNMPECVAFHTGVGDVNHQIIYGGLHSSVETGDISVSYPGCEQWEKMIGSFGGTWHKKGTTGLDREKRYASFSTLYQDYFKNTYYKVGDLRDSNTSGILYTTQYLNSGNIPDLSGVDWSTYVNATSGHITQIAYANSNSVYPDLLNITYFTGGESWTSSAIQYEQLNNSNATLPYAERESALDFTDQVGYFTQNYITPNSNQFVESYKPDYVANPNDSIDGIAAFPISGYFANKENYINVVGQYKYSGHPTDGGMWLWSRPTAGEELFHPTNIHDNPQYYYDSCNVKHISGTWQTYESWIDQSFKTNIGLHSAICWYDAQDCLTLQDSTQEQSQGFASVTNTSRNYRWTMGDFRPKANRLSPSGKQIGCLDANVASDRETLYKLGYISLCDLINGPSSNVELANGNSYSYLYAWDTKNNFRRVILCPATTSTQHYVGYIDNGTSIDQINVTGIVTDINTALTIAPSSNWATYFDYVYETIQSNVAPLSGVSFITGSPMESGLSMPIQIDYNSNFFSTNSISSAYPTYTVNPTADLVGYNSKCFTPIDYFNQVWFIPSIPVSSCCNGNCDYLFESPYNVMTSDQLNGPTYEWIDISGTGSKIISTGADDSTTSIPLGINFPFYGNVFNSAYICSNGFISFTDSSTSTSPSATHLPSPSVVLNIIALLWDDLNFQLGSSAVYYKQIDSDTIVIQYNKATLYRDNTGSLLLTAQIQLHRDGTITLLYQRVDDPSDATVGIQNSNGTKGVEVSYNQTGIIHPGLAIRFQPIPTDIICTTTNITGSSGYMGNILSNKEISIPTSICISADGIQYGCVSTSGCVYLNPCGLYINECDCFTSNVSGASGDVRVFYHTGWFDDRIDALYGCAKPSGFQVLTYSESCENSCLTWWTSGCHVITIPGSGTGFYWVHAKDATYLQRETGYYSNEFAISGCGSNTCSYGIKDITSYWNFSLPQTNDINRLNNLRDFYDILSFGLPEDYIKPSKFTYSFYISRDGVGLDQFFYGSKRNTFVERWKFPHTDVILDTLNFNDSSPYITNNDGSGNFIPLSESNIFQYGSLSVGEIEYPEFSTSWDGSIDGSSILNAIITMSKVQADISSASRVANYYNSGTNTTSASCNFSSLGEWLNTSVDNTLPEKYSSHYYPMTYDSFNGPTSGGPYFLPRGTTHQSQFSIIPSSNSSSIRDRASLWPWCDLLAGKASNKPTLGASTWYWDVNGNIWTAEVISIDQITPTFCFDQTSNTDPLHRKLSPSTINSLYPTTYDRETYRITCQDKHGNIVVNYKITYDEVAGPEIVGSKEGFDYNIFGTALKPRKIDLLNYNNKPLSGPTQTWVENEELNSIHAINWRRTSLEGTSGCSIDLYPYNRGTICEMLSGGYYKNNIQDGKGYFCTIESDEDTWIYSAPIGNTGLSFNNDNFFIQSSPFAISSILQGSISGMSTTNSSLIGSGYCIIDGFPPLTPICHSVSSAPSACCYYPGVNGQCLSFDIASASYQYSSNVCQLLVSTSKIINGNIPCISSGLVNASSIPLSSIGFFSFGQPSPSGYVAPYTILGWTECNQNYNSMGSEIVRSYRYSNGEVDGGIVSSAYVTGPQSFGIGGLGLGKSTAMCGSLLYGGQRNPCQYSQFSNSALDTTPDDAIVNKAWPWNILGFDGLLGPNGYTDAIDSQGNYWIAIGDINNTNPYIDSQFVSFTQNKFKNLYTIIKVSADKKSEFFNTTLARTNWKEVDGANLNGIVCLSQYYNLLTEDIRGTRFREGIQEALNMVEGQRYYDLYIKIIQENVPNVNINSSAKDKINYSSPTYIDSSLNTQISGAYTLPLEPLSISPNVNVIQGLDLVSQFDINCISCSICDSTFVTDCPSASPWMQHNHEEWVAPYMESPFAGPYSEQGFNIWLTTGKEPRWGVTLWTSLEEGKVWANYRRQRLHVNEYRDHVVLASMTASVAIDDFASISTSSYDLSGSTSHVPVYVNYDEFIYCLDDYRNAKAIQSILDSENENSSNGIDCSDHMIASVNNVFLNSVSGGPIIQQINGYSCNVSTNPCSAFNIQLLQNTNQGYVEWATSFIQEYRSLQDSICYPEQKHFFKYNLDSNMDSNTYIGLHCINSNDIVPTQWRRYQDGVGLGGDAPALNLFDGNTEFTCQRINQWFIGQSAIGNTESSVIVGGYAIAGDGELHKSKSWWESSTFGVTFKWNTKVIQPEDTSNNNYKYRTLSPFFSSGENAGATSSLGVTIFDVGSNTTVERQGSAKFENNITTYAVKFTNAIPDYLPNKDKYSISLVCSDNVKVWWSNKSSSGFTINAEAKFSGYVDWSIYLEDAIPSDKIDNLDEQQTYDEFYEL